MAKPGSDVADRQARRRADVTQLRAAGLSQMAIARQLGISSQTVNADLKHVREEWQKRTEQDFGAWVAEHLAKLDALEEAWLPRAVNPRRADEKAAQIALSVLDRRAKILGLDKPTLHEHTVITQDALDAEIARLEAELA